MDLMAYIFGKKNDPISLAIEAAIVCLEDKNYDEAIETLHKRALSRDPEHRRALLHLGIAHMLKGEFDTAEELLVPLTRVSGMDSESAAAKIALDKIARDRKAAHGQA